jgi:hypothetical protein
MSMSFIWVSAPIFFLSACTAMAVDSQLLSERELSKRLQFYQSIATLTVDFKQLKILKDLHVEIPSEGKLKLKGHEQVIWEVSKPSLVRLTFDHKMIKVESGEGADYSLQTWKTSDLPKGKESKNIAALEAWLLLDARVLGTQYSVTSQGPGTLRFASKDHDKPAFRNVEMHLASSGHLEQLHITEASGDEIDIRFGAPTVTYEKGGSIDSDKRRRAQL